MTIRKYAVLWSDDDGSPLGGTLEFADGGLRFEGSAGDREALRRIEYARIASLHLGRESDERVAGRPALVLRLRDAKRVLRIATSEPGALHELTERLAVLTEGKGEPS